MNEEFIKIFNFIFEKYSLISIKNKLDKSIPINDIKIINDIDSFINKLNDNDNNKIKSVKEEIIYLSNTLISFLRKNDNNIEPITTYNKIYDLIINIVERFNFIRIRNLNDDIYYELKHISNNNFNQRKNMINSFIRKHTSNTKINIEI